MNFKQVVAAVQARGFPIQTIEDMDINIHGTKFEVRDSSSPDGKREVEDDYTKQHLAGITTVNIFHTIEGKSKTIKHECTQTNYDTKVEGWPVEYSYKFCPRCKKYMAKKATVLDYKENQCETVKFDEEKKMIQYRDEPRGTDIFDGMV